MTSSSCAFFLLKVQTYRNLLLDAAALSRRAKICLCPSGVLDARRKKTFQSQDPRVE